MVQMAMIVEMVRVEEEGMRRTGLRSWRCEGPDGRTGLETSTYQ